MNQRKLKKLRKKSLSEEFTVNNVLIKGWFPNIKKDKNLKNALKHITKIKDISSHIAIMPDYSVSKNSINGLIIPTENNIYPEIIGGDIGCGMLSLSIPAKYEEIEKNLKDIYKLAYSQIPTGNRQHPKLPDFVLDSSLFNTDLELLTNKLKQKAAHQLGTLGSGNHFIELQMNQQQYLNIMIHTGSRNLGQVIAKFFREKATRSSNNGPLFLEGKSSDGKNYLDHHQFAQKYAQQNRLTIANNFYDLLSSYLPKLNDQEIKSKVFNNIIDLPHNYVFVENHTTNKYIHRKGAIKIPENSFGIIPGSMGTKSYIVIGRGNPDSFYSASHGAGRKLFRSDTNKISYKDFQNSIEHVVSRKDNKIVNECPLAYNDIDTIMSYQKDLVKISEQLIPIINIKG